MSNLVRTPRYALALAAAALGVASVSAVAWRLDAANDSRSGTAARPEDLAHAKALSSAFRMAAKEVIPSVVTIQKTYTPERKTARRSRTDRESPESRVPEQFRGTPFEDFFNDDRFRGFGFDFDEFPQMPREQSGMGSGVIIDPSGVILTNNHVVRGPGKVTVKLSDGREFDAAEIKTDPRTDLAVVRIKNASNLKSAKLGDSDQLEIGDWVVAIGNPFGLSETVTAGIISAKGRGLGIAQREDFLQTDAAINPGNSGGPLINLDGEVIGINTAISSRSGGYEGIGFTIPINLARWVSQQLMTHGAVKRAYLGARIQPVTQDLARQFEVPTQQGALVAEVIKDSPAEEAGLKRGDVVTRVGSKKVATPSELIAAVEQIPIDQKTRVEVLRDGKPVELSVTVREQPKDYGIARTDRDSEEEQPEKRTSVEIEELGLEVDEVSESVAKRLDLTDKSGVEIVAVERGSVAAQAGLRPGDVISEVNRKPVKTLDDFRGALKKNTLEDGVLLLVQSDRGSRYLSLRVR
jgi:serine protease Do